jgi:exodeoxyribonuclease V alpha subunit
LVVDEASMIDSFLFLGLVRALPSHARLVLLGDVDQLPSVGPGNILHDLIDSGAVHVTRLTEIFRQAQDSMIVVNAHKINRGEFPSARGEKQDFFVLKKSPEECLVALSQIYRKKLPQLGISPDDAVVLVPMNRGLVGTQRINATLQNVLNPKHPDKKEVSRYGTVYRSGDRVMQIRNNYTKFVFNGDLGVIKEIDTTAQKMIITFGERDLEYDFYEISELILAYAISIHKSQGSEFRAVIVPVAMQHFVLLQKNLIYTAVTRAKQLCILMGEPRAIGMALRNTKESKRHTFLRHYLENQEPFTVDIDTFFGEGLDLDTLS